jgi:cytochrome b561
VSLVEIKFRLIIPLLYLVVGILPLIGMIATIAEGPNPFAFLWFLSMPGFFIAEAINQVLGLVPSTYEIIVLLVGMLLNIGIYFALGWLIDCIFNRRRRKLLT